MEILYGSISHPIGEIKDFFRKLLRTGVKKAKSIEQNDLLILQKSLTANPNIPLLDSPVAKPSGAKPADFLFSSNHDPWAI
jgi:hypothetical protein